jgi:hypothetical protein
MGLRTKILLTQPLIQRGRIQQPKPPISTFTSVPATGRGSPAPLL